MIHTGSAHVADDQARREGRPPKSGKYIVVMLLSADTKLAMARKIRRLRVILGMA